MTEVDDAWVERKQRLLLSYGRKLAYVHLAGNGPTLLMIHGFTDTSRSYADLATRFEAFNLVIPDLPGHGASAPRRVEGRAAGIAAFSRDLSALLDHLGIDTLFIIGHSMGGMIATDLAALLGDRVQGLVILASALVPAMPADGFVAEAIAGFHDPIDPAHPFFDEWHACALPVDEAFIAVARREAAAMKATVWRSIFEDLSRLDLRDKAASVHAPVLSLAGSEDPLFGPAQQAELVAAFQNARGISLKGQGHNLHWEKPETISAYILEVVGKARLS